MEQEKRGIYVNTQKTKISFAAAWLVAYLAGLKISGILSGIIGIQNLGQAIFRACFVIVMILYLKKRETLEFYGIRSLKNLDGRGTFYFIPFVLLVVVPFCFGIQNSEPLLDVGNIFWKEDVQTVSMIFGLLILISVFYGVYLLKTKRKLLK